MSDIQEQFLRPNPQFNVNPSGLPQVKRAGDAGFIGQDIIPVMEILDFNPQDYSTDTYALIRIPHNQKKPVLYYGRYKYQNSYFQSGWYTFPTVISTSDTGSLGMQYVEIVEINEDDIAIYFHNIGIPERMQIFLTNFGV